MAVTVLHISGLTSLFTSHSVMGTNMSASGPARELGRELAVRFDSEDQIKDLRKEFIIPTKRDFKSKTLSSPCEISHR